MKPAYREIEKKIVACINDIPNNQNIYAVVVGSSWATREVSVLSINGKTRVISDIDLHVIVRKKDPALAKTISDCLKKRIPYLHIDCNFFPKRRLGRLKPTFEAVITGQSGIVLYGNKSALSFFPTPEQIPRTEVLRLLLNRIAELLHPFLSNGTAKYPNGYLAVKAMADIAFIILSKHKVFLPSYRERLDFLKRLQKSKECKENEIELITTAIRGIQMKLGIIPLGTEDELYNQARVALEKSLVYSGFNIEMIHLELPKQRIFGSAWKGWLRLILNRHIALSYSIPKNFAQLVREPRIHIYIILLLLFFRLNRQNLSVNTNDQLLKRLYDLFPVKIPPECPVSSESFFPLVYNLFMAEVHKKEYYPHVQ